MKFYLFFLSECWMNIWKREYELLLEFELVLSMIFLFDLFIYELKFGIGLILKIWLVVFFIMLCVSF